jgi:hypothetical protein
MLFGLLLAFIALVMLMDVTQESRPSPELKAEFVVIVTWDDESFHDVDTWVEDPNGNHVAFNSREAGLMHLDRDDLGRRNDVIDTLNGRKQVLLNREMVSIRGIVEGEYVANVHMFRKQPNDAIPCTVRVELQKINPFKIITIQNVILMENGNEQTAFRFIVNRDGNVTEINRLHKKIATVGEIQ